VKHTGIVCDHRYKNHDPGPGHPEAPARYDAAMEGIETGAAAQENLVRLAPRSAVREEVMLCHSDEYFRIVEMDVRGKERCLRTGDTNLCDASLDVALLAVGGALTAVDAVIEGQVSNAFCVLRPPGHHATRDRGMGFCVFNNVAIAARYAQQRHNVDRVVIVDWDIHHGNGTQMIFDDDPSVFYFSTHQWPLYPGTGRAGERGQGVGRGHTLNCPLAAGAGRHEVVEALRSKLVPAMRRFRPELVFISAGFDAAASDPLGHFDLSAGDFEEMTGIVMEMAAEHANARIVSMLEGGYDLTALAEATGRHVHRLAAG